jgi:hypothetical protein
MVAMVGRKRKEAHHRGLLADAGFRRSGYHRVVFDWPDAEASLLRDAAALFHIVVLRRHEALERFFAPGTLLSVCSEKLKWWCRDERLPLCSPSQELAC